MLFTDGLAFFSRKLREHTAEPNDQNAAKFKMKNSRNWLVEWSYLFLKQFTVWNGFNAAITGNRNYVNLLKFEITICGGFFTICILCAFGCKWALSSQRKSTPICKQLLGQNSEQGFLKSLSEAKRFWCVNVNLWIWILVVFLC